MRDVKRIDRIMNKLRKLWELQEMRDMRFGQLLWNYFYNDGKIRWNEDDDTVERNLNRLLKIYSDGKVSLLKKPSA